MRNNNKSGAPNKQKKHINQLFQLKRKHLNKGFPHIIKQDDFTFKTIIPILPFIRSGNPRPAPLSSPSTRSGKSDEKQWIFSPNHP